MHSCESTIEMFLLANARKRMRRTGMFLALLILSPASFAALNEVNASNPYTLSPPVSVGSYYDITLQIRNNGTSLVNLTSFSTTGPFTLQWNTCGSSLAAGAACSGNIGLRFMPTAAGTASGSLVVGNDSGDGPFTLNLVATGTALLAPTVTAVFSPNSIYSVTGVSTLTLTFANPNSVFLTPSFINVNLPAGIKTAASPSPASSCGGGIWSSPGDQPPANQPLVEFLGRGTVIPANGSCAISIDVVSSNAPGTYTFNAQPLATSEVWSAAPANAALTIVAPIPGTPGAPAIVSVTGGNGQATVTFAAPTDTGASTISGYTVTSRPPGGVDVNAGSASLSHVITGLANGTAYTFAVTAANTAGAGAPAALSAAVTPATLPGSPANAIATAGNALALVTFAPPASNGGSAITGYTVTSSPAGGVDSNAGSTSLSHKITGLANGTDYTFTVVAANVLGTGASSIASNHITPAIPLVRTPPQMTYQIPQSRSMITTPVSVIPPGPRVLPNFETAYLAPRSFEFADFNGDGYLDIVVAPAFAQHLPKLPIAIWLNRGDGTFYDGTADVMEGAPPLTWNATQILIGDVNNDGRPDVFILSTGAEFAVAEGLPDSGFYNTLLLSQPSGKYKDATAQINSNASAFNHMGGMGDANGDGNLDVLVNAGGTTLVKVNGIKLLYGDGRGNFSDATSALPPEIRWMPDTQRPGDLAFPNFEYQPTGCAGLADLDGDGKAEVITGTYSTPDRGPNGRRTVRIHKLGTDGRFVERGRVSIPDAIASIEYGYDPPPPVFAGLGCSQIVAGDFNGDGRVDLLVQWEGAGKWYVELLRNDGNFQFTDITLEALGKYEQGFKDFGATVANMGPSHYRLLDINGDGTLDIVSQLGGTSITNLIVHSAYVNDGAGHFTPWIPQGPSGPLTPADFLSASKCSNCSYEPMVFDTNRSGFASVVLLDFQSSVTSSTPSQTSAIYLTAFTPAATAPVLLNLVQGWNLLGNGVNSALDVTAILGDTAKVLTVWKWIAGKAKWAFYTPSLAGQALADYAASKGYDVLAAISGGEGFWVNAKIAFTAPLPSSTAVSSSSFQGMASGWNLIATGESNSPSQFNALAGAATPFTTLWSWDAVQTNWYFYAPSLAAKGGTALGDYITGKGYLDFTTTGKTLGPGLGFWVNKP